MVQQGDHLFTLIWRPGPSWVVGKPIQEQDLGEHRDYFGELSRRGLVVIAGPFIDPRSGGMAVLRAADLEAAQSIFSQDPAVVAGVFLGDVRPFYTVYADAIPESVAC